MALTIPEPSADALARDLSSKPFHWQIDRRVPVALIVAILMQSAVFGIWLGRTEARLDALEQFVHDNKATDARLAVIETRLEAMRETLGEIDHKLNVKE